MQTFHLDNINNNDNNDGDDGNIYMYIFLNCYLGCGNWHITIAELQNVRKYKWNETDTMDRQLK